ncbi:IPExxxVDY family protein [Chryseobacterium wanjuense]
MEIQKLYDLDDIEFEDITIGLVRLAKNIPDHEFFFNVNQKNDLTFKRIDDLIFHGAYYDYFFPRFEAYHKFTKTCFTFISNKSSESKQKNTNRTLLRRRKH